MRYYFRAFKKYADSDGRANRRELIWFFVFHYLIMVILSFMDGYFGLYPTEIPLDYGYLTLAYIFATACPCICLRIRRLHDVGKSGSWWWAGNVPFVSLYVLYLYLKRGDDCVNEYGAPINHKPFSVEPIEPPVVEQSNPMYISQPLVAETNKICFCRKCGERLIVGSRFCRKCGTEVVEVQQA